MNHFLILTTLSQFDDYYSKKSNRNEIDSLLLIDGQKKVTFFTDKEDIYNDRILYTKISKDLLLFKIYYNNSSKIPISFENFEKIKKLKMIDIHRMDSITFSKKFSFEEWII